MTAHPKGLPQDLAAAIEDLRHIRRSLDTARSNHPLRVVARPLLGYSIVLGLFVIAFGVGAQLLLNRNGGALFGMAPEEFGWIVAGLLLVVAGIAKLAVVDAASRRAGYDVVAVLRATYTTAYLQIMIPGALLVVLGSVALDQLGGDALILGFASAGFGALVIAVSTSVALPEWSLFGGLLFLLGAVSMFALPQWPFYALAVCWGGTLVTGGLVLRRRFPRTASS